MEPDMEAGIDRAAKFTVERFVGRNYLSVGKFLDSRFHGNDARLEPTDRHHPSISDRGYILDFE